MSIPCLHGVVADGIGWGGEQQVNTDPFLGDVNLLLKFDDEELQPSLYIPGDFDPSTSSTGIRVTKYDPSIKRVLSKLVATQGKVVFEFKVFDNRGMYLGFADPQMEVYTGDLGLDSISYQRSVGYRYDGGHTPWSTHNTYIPSVGVSFSSGDVVTFYVDVDAGAHKIYRNGVLIKGDVFVAGHPIVPAISIGQIGGSVEFRHLESEMQYLNLEPGYSTIPLSGHGSRQIKNEINNSALSCAFYGQAYPYATKSAGRSFDGKNSFYCGDADLSRAGMVRWNSTGSVDTGDFTFECWFWLEAFKTNFVQAVLGDYRQQSWGLNLWELSIAPSVSGFATENLKTLFFTASGNTIYSVDKVIEQQWMHVAIVRKAGVISLYLDGKYQSQVVNADSFDNITALGTDWSNRGFFGYVDFVRTTKAARYEGNFTPPGRTVSGGGFGVGGYAPPNRNVNQILDANSATYWDFSESSGDFLDNAGGNALADPGALVQRNVGIDGFPSIPAGVQFFGNAGQALVEKVPSNALAKSYSITLGFWTDQVDHSDAKVIGAFNEDGLPYSAIYRRWHRNNLYMDGWLFPHAYKENNPDVDVYQLHVGLNITATQPGRFIVLTREYSPSVVTQKQYENGALIGISRWYSQDYQYSIQPFIHFPLAKGDTIFSIAGDPSGNTFTQAGAMRLFDVNHFKGIIAKPFVCHSVMSGSDIDELFRASIANP